MSTQQARNHPLKEVELQAAMEKIAPNHTPLWEHWDEFKKRYGRLNRSENTIQNVKDAIRLFVVHLEVISIEQCSNILDLEDRLHAYREARRITYSTFNSYLKNINIFFIWMKRYGFIKENPIPSISKGKPEFRAKHIITDEQVHQIIAFLSLERCTSFERARNILIIHLLRITGARPKEIMTLKKTDISRLDGSYKISIKGIKQGGKLRPYRMKGALKDAYENYLFHLPKERAHEPWLLLSRKHGKPFGLKGLRYLFKQLQKKLQFKITAYGFRRYVTTTLKKKGLPMEKIKDHMGHSSIKTTQTYIDDLCDWTDEGVDILT